MSKVRTHLRNARLAKGLSQEKLGNAIGAGQSQVALWEQCRGPGRKNAQRLAEFFGMAQSYLLDEGIVEVDEKSHRATKLA